MGLSKSEKETLKALKAKASSEDLKEVGITSGKTSYNKDELKTMTTDYIKVLASMVWIKSLGRLKVKINNALKQNDAKKYENDIVGYAIKNDLQDKSVIKEAGLDELSDKELIKALEEMEDYSVSKKPKVKK